MKEYNDIDTIFKEHFAHFEADVNPDAWATIQQELSAAPTTTPPQKHTIGKIGSSVGLIAIGIIAVSIWYILSTNHPMPGSKESATNPPNLIVEDEVNNTTPPPASAKEKDALYNSAPVINIHHKKNNTPLVDITLTEQIKRMNENHPAAHPPTAQNNTESTTAHSLSFDQQQNSPPITTADKPLLPVAHIFSNTTFGEAPLTVKFINNGQASTHLWNFGDGATSNENNPTHVFTKAGIYIINLTAKNAAGSSYDKVTVEVKSTSEIINIPNIFTPNADGENDFFYFDTKNISSLSVVLFNRQQTVVYQWDGLEGKWNGKLKDGSDAAEGTYYYAISAKGTDGINHSKKGAVFLKRQ
jgi:gliding motility-associated-like protein